MTTNNVNILSEFTPASTAVAPNGFFEGCSGFRQGQYDQCAAGTGNQQCGASLDAAGSTANHCVNVGSTFIVQSNLGASYTKMVGLDVTPYPQPGLSASTDLGSMSADKYAYMCMDWTVGSARMTSAENSYLARTSDAVYFGVGTSGCDQVANLGGCYRITYATGKALANAGNDWGRAGIERDLIVQSVNSGGDVHCPQFDLQVGVGGQGYHNNCVANDNSDAEMFGSSATQASMGLRYGGHRNRAQCTLSPQTDKMTTEGDNLVQLCEASFDRKLRGENGLNSRMIRVSRVTCPVELTKVSNFRRADQDHFGHAHNTQGLHTYIDPETGPDCGYNDGSSAGKHCLSRMMDCRKPSASFKDNVDTENLCAGMKVLPACAHDGYTRIESDCGCANCWC